MNVSYKNDPKVKVFDGELSAEYFGEDDNGYHDEWYGLIEYGDDFAVDFNYFVDEEDKGIFKDCSRFYGCFFNDHSGYIEVDTNCYSDVYKIDFDDPEWKDKLIQAAYEFLINRVI